MSTKSITVHHEIACDLCGADGGRVLEGAPRLAGWERYQGLDICPTCVGTLTLREFLDKRRTPRAEIAPGLFMALPADQGG